MMNNKDIITYFNATHKRQIEDYMIESISEISIRRNMIVVRILDEYVIKKGEEESIYGVKGYGLNMSGYLNWIRKNKINKITNVIH